MNTNISRVHGLRSAFVFIYKQRIRKMIFFSNFIIRRISRKQLLFSHAAHFFVFASIIGCWLYQFLCFYFVSKQSVWLLLCDEIKIKIFLLTIIVHLNHQTFIFLKLLKTSHQATMGKTLVYYFVLVFKVFFMHLLKAWSAHFLVKN